MDNPQHYQPLSHALQPVPTSSSIRPHYSTTGHYGQQKPLSADHHLEEEEEEEEDDDDEGMVEEQLNQADADMHGSGPPSPKGSTCVWSSCFLRIAELSP